MSLNWDDELRAAVKREVDKAPPFSPATQAVIASTFRGSQNPWRTDKLRRRP